jgi:hypothetical protein
MIRTRRIARRAEAFDARMAQAAVRDKPETIKMAADDARAAFEADLEEALGLIAAPPETGSSEDDRLGELLDRITAARPEFAPEGGSHPYQDQFSTLEAHIASLDARVRADRRPDGQPMSPLVGFDLDESQHPERKH